MGGGVGWLLADCEGPERRLSRLYDLFFGEDAVYDTAVLMDTSKIKLRAARNAFAGMLSLPERETRPSVVGTVQSHLRLLDSDLVRRLTDTTSIDLDALVAGKPMSLFIIVPPHRLAAYAPLLRLWITGLLQAFAQREKPPEHRTLLICDEAAALGRMDALLTAAALMRAWGVTLWTAWQNAAQLDIYESQAKTLVDNAGVIQLMGVKNRRMAADFGALVGMEADEIMSMGADEQLLLIDGGKPLRARQVRYYQEAMFKGQYDEGPLVWRPSQAGRER